MSDEKKKVSPEELYELLNDPENLQRAQAIMASKGHTPAAAPPPPAKKTELAVPQIEDLPADASVADVKRVYEKALKDFAKNNSAYVEELLAAKEAEATQSDVDKRLNEARAFGAKRKHFFDPEIMKIMDPLFSAGIDIEEAYKTAIKATGKSDDTLEAPPTEVEEKPVKKTPQNRQVPASASVPTEDLTEVNTLDTKEAARKNLDAIIAEEGDDFLKSRTED